MQFYPSSERLSQGAQPIHTSRTPRRRRPASHPISALTTCSKARSNSSSNRTACRMPLKAVCCCWGSSAKGRKLLSKGRLTVKAGSTPGLRTAVPVSGHGQQLWLFTANCPQSSHRHFQRHRQPRNSEIKDTELHAACPFVRNQSLPPGAERDRKERKRAPSFVSDFALCF